MGNTAVFCFAALLMWAAACDVSRMEIPNRISVLLAASYPPLAWAAGVPLPEIGLHLACGLAALAVCFILFQAGVFGGGDAKILAAAIVWTGLGALTPFLLATCLFGGVLTLAILAARRLAQPKPAFPEFLNRLLQPDNGSPYVVAIAAAGFFVAPQLPLLLA